MAIIRNYTCPVCGKDCSKAVGRVWRKINGKNYMVVQWAKSKPFKGVTIMTYIHTACYEQNKRGKPWVEGGETGA